MLFLIILSGCIFTDSNSSQDDTIRFIGTWELEPFEGSDPRDTATYTFYKNGTLLSIFDDYDGEVHQGLAYYTVDDGSICMKTVPHGSITDNDSYCYSYIFSLEDTRLTLFNAELPSVILVKGE